MPRRMIPKAPSFIRTPAWSMLTAVGAATWPSGDHVWNGHRPASTPQPMTNTGKTAFWKPSEKWTLYSAGRSKVPMFALTKMAKMPMKMSTLAATR